MNNFIKNLIHTLFSNLISLMVSLLLVVIVPKVIDVEQYGYWQLYLFYSAYVGFFQFGWGDGIYLRYGGEEYSKLNKKIFSEQLISMLILQLTLATILYVAFFYLYNLEFQKIVFVGIIMNMLILNMTAILTFILQATNRLKENAKQNIVGRVLYLMLIIVILLIKLKKYEYFIVCDILAKLISFMIALYYCREILTAKISEFKIPVHEIKENIRIGIKLMFANIASMLIIGVFRFVIEKKWDIATFAKISLIINIASFLMIFANTLSILIFPLLKRTSLDKYNHLYKAINSILTPFLLGTLIFYYPMKQLLSLWLIHYADYMIYLALILPMILYEIKFSILASTFFKALRQEKKLMQVNFISLFFSFLLSTLTAYYFKNLNMLVLSMVTIIIFRSLLSESLLNKWLKNKMEIKNYLEIILIVIFMLLAKYNDNIKIIPFYLIFYSCYLYIMKNDINRAIKNIRSMRG